MKSYQDVKQALRQCQTTNCIGCPYENDELNVKCMAEKDQDAALYMELLRRQNLRLREAAGEPKKGKTAPLRWWAEQIHTNAVEHGWWDEERSFGEIVALCHSELSEALEEYRAGRDMVWYACEECKDDPHPCDPQDEYECRAFGFEAGCVHRGRKPEGIAAEMIDCLIRILDWCGKEGVDVDELLAEKHAYNKTRPYRHGGKKL